jgi:hypothetical protein
MAIESQLRRALDVMASLYPHRLETRHGSAASQDRRESEAAEHETDAGASVVHSLVTGSKLNKSSGGHETIFLPNSEHSLSLDLLL